MKNIVFVFFLLFFLGCKNSKESPPTNHQIASVSASHQETIPLVTIVKPKHQFMDATKEFSFYMADIFEYHGLHRNGDTIKDEDLSALVHSKDSIFTLTPVSVNISENGYTNWKIKGNSLFMYLLGASPKDTIIGHFKNKELLNGKPYKLDNGMSISSKRLHKGGYESQFLISLLDSNDNKRDISDSVYAEYNCFAQNPEIYWQGDLNSDYKLDCIVLIDGDYCKDYIMVLSDEKNGYTYHSYTIWTD